jgi:enoyl-CoA hydratase
VADDDERSREEQTDDDDVLLIETADRVRTLTVNRPDVRNALSTGLRDKLFPALRDADEDDDVDVVILTGTDPAFCAGIDLKEIGPGLKGGGGIPDLSPAWPPMTKPVIGAINGVAVTGGFELALCCDILIASENARFADTHARVGLLPSWGMSVRLPQAVGRGLAHRMSLTGDYLGAYDALRVGLVTEVVLHDDLLDAAKAVAASIVDNNRAAVRALLASYHRIDDAQTHASFRIEQISAAEWLRSHARSDAIAANRDAVIKRGRSQIHE